MCLSTIFGFFKESIDSGIESLVKIIKGKHSRYLLMGVLALFLDRI